MDVLSEPTGCLRDMQENLAAFFGADESFFLVNGSTAGIVAAVCAVCKDGDTLYAARNGHASMYSGMALAGAVPEYFYPQIRPDGLPGAVSPDVFDRMPRGAAAFIVSPTYEGFVSDIAAIAARVHERDGILIVDEAHGAHFPFHKAFPPPAISQGADITVNSLHKTLPAPGQTAVLHVRGRRADRARLRFYINAVQTSSPSYILMGAADYALKILWKNPALFDDYVKRLFLLREKLSGGTCGQFARRLINLLPCEKGDDPSKLLFACKPGFAQHISEVLANEHKIQTEMAWGNHILALTSAADTNEGFTRLINAVQAVNARGATLPAGTTFTASREAQSTGKHPPAPPDCAGGIPEVIFPPRAALQLPAETVPVSEAAGRISAELIAPCPPGIALLAPGERIPAGTALPKDRIRVLADTYP
jgi:lysine decarboxylase